MVIHCKKMYSPPFLPLHRLSRGLCGTLSDSESFNQSWHQYTPWWSSCQGPRLLGGGAIASASIHSTLLSIYLLMSAPTTCAPSHTCCPVPLGEEYVWGAYSSGTKELTSELKGKDTWMGGGGAHRQEGGPSRVQLAAKEGCLGILGLGTPKTWKWPCCQWCSSHPTSLCGSLTTFISYRVGRP